MKRTIEYRPEGANEWRAVDLAEETGKHTLWDIIDALKLTGAFKTKVAAGQELHVSLDHGAVGGWVVARAVVPGVEGGNIGEWRGAGEFVTVPKPLNEAWQRMLAGLVDASS